jgi:protein TonB
MQASVSEKLASALGALLFVALFGYLLLIGLTVETNVAVQQRMAVLNLRAPLPQHHPRPPVARPAPHKASRASPRNLRNKAAKIVAPPLVVPLAIPSPVIVAAKPGVGMASSAGASDKAGPGQGAGGKGDGNGNGDGDGDGDTPPRQIRGRLKFSDLPADLRDKETGGTVSVHYRVGIDGRVGDCEITASSGSAELDQLTCSLIQQRFRFDPSRNSDGHPVSSIVEEQHSWEFDESHDGSRP